MTSPAYQPGPTVVLVHGAFADAGRSAQSTRLLAGVTASYASQRIRPTSGLLPGVPRWPPYATLAG